MKFLGDIPIARATIEHLSQRGHDVVRVRDCLSPTASDADIIRLAAEEARVVLCFDLDMASLVALSGEMLPSVLTFRTSKHHATFVNQRLDAILPDIEADLRGGVLVTVEDSRVRIRPLPIKHKS